MAHSPVTLPRHANPFTALQKDRQGTCSDYWLTGEPTHLWSTPHKACGTARPRPQTSHRPPRPTPSAFKTSTTSKLQSLTGFGTNRWRNQKLFPGNQLFISFNSMLCPRLHHWGLLNRPHPHSTALNDKCSNTSVRSSYHCSRKAEVRSRPPRPTLKPEAKIR